MSFSLLSPEENKAEVSRETFLEAEKAKSMICLEEHLVM